jgi:hypothetical protein
MNNSTLVEMGSLKKISLFLIGCLFVFSGWAQDAPPPYEPIVEVYNLAGEHQDDFYPGETAVLKGSGWTLDQFVDVHLHENPEYDHDHDFHDTEVDENGNWEIRYPIEERHLGVTFNVEIHGLQSGYTAKTVFTDSHSVSSVFPNSGTIAGGTNVIVNGNGFTGNVANYVVTFGGSAATILSKNSNEISVTTPAHTAGLVNVVVSISGHEAKLTGGYTYTCAAPSPPTSVSATPTTICVGGASNLKATTSSGNTINWYTVSSGGSSIGSSASGVNFPVSPAITTTYYAEAQTSGGCKSTIRSSVGVTVAEQPVAPTILAKTPNLSAICAGQGVSATFNAGIGGTGCSDDYTVSIDGATGIAYTPGTTVGTGATNSIVIQGRRANCTSGAGCTGTNYVTLANWTVGDNTPPVFISQPEAIADINCDDTLPIQQILTATDNCGTATVTPSVDPYSVNTCVGYQITYRWVAKDNSTPANETVVTKTFNVLPDTADPTFDSTPNAIADISCDDALPTQETLTASDTCGDATVVSSVDPYTVDKCAGYAITYRWTATDDCGNDTETWVTFNVLPDTEAPELGNIQGPQAPVQVGVDFTLLANYSDNCSANSGSVSWYFSSDGDFIDLGINDYTEFVITGSTLNATFNSSNFSTPENPKGAGVYSVKLVVTDVCGNETSKTYDYVVIYDPSGGFVTGGGWINSPVGAYKNDPNATGKANFGFNAKYKTGKNNLTEVDGNTNFQFKEGNFHFKSSSHENMSLIISGEKKATYRGIGSVNGSGSHYFIVTVIDGDAQGGDGKDKFRIVVYANGTTSPSGTPIYDNESNAVINADASTVLGGGSIVIHKPKGNSKAQEEVVVKTKPDVMREMAPEILESLALSPNPVVEKSIVRFSVKEDALVTLRLFDHSGRMIETLFQGKVKAFENHDVDLNRRNLMSGVYIVKLTANTGHSYEKRLIIE